MIWAELAAVLAATTTTTGAAAGGGSGSDFPWTEFLVGLTGAAAGAAGATWGAALLEKRRENGRLRAAARLLYEELDSNLVLLHAERVYPGDLLGRSDSERPGSFEAQRWRDLAPVFAELASAADYQALFDCYQRLRYIPSYPTREEGRDWGPAPMGGTYEFREDQLPEGIQLTERALRLAGGWAEFEKSKVALDIAHAAPVPEGEVVVDGGTDGGTDDSR